MNREQKEELDFIDSVLLYHAKEYLVLLGIPTHEAEEMAQWALENEIEDLDNLPEEYLKAKKETQEDEDYKLMVRVN